MNADIEIPDGGEPRIAGRRLPVLTVVLQISSLPQSVEEYADERGLDEEDVEAALSWASAHPEQMDELIQRRAESMRRMAEKEYPEFVDGANIDNEDVADFQQRARQALAEMIKDSERYGDTRFDGKR